MLSDPTILSQHLTTSARSGLELATHEALLRNLEALCSFAHGMIEVHHSGFVLFDKTFQRGQVVAQFPNEGFEKLLGREVQLEGVAAEQQLINVDAAIEILDVNDPAERHALGPVAAT